MDLSALFHLDVVIVKRKILHKTILSSESFSWFFPKILAHIHYTQKRLFYLNECVENESICLVCDSFERWAHQRSVLRCQRCIFDVIYVYYTREHENSIEIRFLFLALHDSCVCAFLFFNFRENGWLELSPCKLREHAHDS